MDCPNIQDCQLLRLKDDLGLVVIDNNCSLGEETLLQVYNRFAGIETMDFVRDVDNIGIGRFYFRGVFLCDGLENPDFMMPIGTYPLDITYSSKFKSFLPEFHIKGHSGLRIHVANSFKDLKGCIGVGVKLSSGNLLAYSAITLDRLIKVIRECQINFFRIY